MLAHGLSASLPIRRDSPWCGNRNCKSTKSRNKPISQCAAGSILLCQPAQLIGEADRPRPANPCLSAVLSSGTRNSLQLNARATRAVKRTHKQLMRADSSLMHTPVNCSGQYARSVGPSQRAVALHGALGQAHVLHVCLVPAAIFRVQPLCLRWPVGGKPLARPHRGLS